MSAPRELLVYGANGYTAELVAREAVRTGLRPALAARRPDAARALASELGLELVALSLDDPAALASALARYAVVLHCAGPFARTSRPMADACLASGAHYLDITGEVEVFESLARRDAEAKARGVMLLPGTGFDVVPSDCLAAHLASRLPGAKHLALAFLGTGGVSHGTATTIVENLAKGGVVRRDGKLVPVPSAHKRRTIDFGRGPTSTMAIPWGDVSTAYHSTGIPNIEVFMAAPASMIWGSILSRPFGPLLGSAPAQRLLKGRIREGGPGPASRARARSYLWGEVTDGARTCVSRLVAPEGYTLTAMTSVAIARRVLAGEAPPGFQTPSRAYGKDFVLGFDGVERRDEE